MSVPKAFTVYNLFLQGGDELNYGSYSSRRKNRYLNQLFLGNYQRSN